MAVTKIWPIKDSLRRVVDYARNPAKTEYTDLQTVLHYAANGEKTEHGAEKIMYVTGINCSRDRAFREMYAVQESFGKTGGNVAYHAYQSFKPGEVTPELCHQMGVELAKRMWGEGHQVLVATHFNTGTYHNHLVINSVNMWDGRKFDCSKRAYYELRRLSDELCEEHGLSVIRAPGGRTPRSIYFAEKNGEPTRYNLMRQAIDEAAAIARTPRDFDAIMRAKGAAGRTEEIFHDLLRRQQETRPHGTSGRGLRQQIHPGTHLSGRQPCPFPGQPGVLAGTARAPKKQVGKGQPQRQRTPGQENHGSAGTVSSLLLFAGLSTAEEAAQASVAGDAGGGAPHGSLLCPGKACSRAQAGQHPGGGGLHHANRKCDADGHRPKKQAL